MSFKSDTHNTEKKKELEKLNGTIRCLSIHFREDGHIYSIDGLESASLVSGTGLVHRQWEKFDAFGVSKKCVGRGEYKKFKSAAAIRRFWRKGANDGTYDHDNIENYENGLVHDRDRQEFKYFLEWKHALPELLADLIEDPVKRYALPFRTEMRVWNGRDWFVGSVDALYELGDGRILLVDWKRVKKMRTRAYMGRCGITHECADRQDCNFQHYSLQVNMYANQIEEFYGREVAAVWLVAIHPNQETFLQYVVERDREWAHSILTRRLVEVAGMRFGKCFIDIDEQH